MNSGQFRQVDEKGSDVQFGVREGEWRLEGDGGSKEFTMREWGDKGRWGQMAREGEGGEWDLKRGRGWGEGGVTSPESVDMKIFGESKEEEEIGKVFCCDSLTGVKILITLFGVINLGIIATGGMGFTLCLVDYWSEQDLFTSVMVIIIISIYSIIMACCVRLGQVVLCVGALLQPPWMSWLYWGFTRGRKL